METIHLLAVSREATLLRLLWSIAESNSWHLETVASGIDAMERVQSGSVPHLLLLDLPRGDAESLHSLRWLRRIRPELPVIGLGSADDAAGAREALHLGAQEILSGPFSEQQIEFVIQRHLAPSGNGVKDATHEPFEQLGQEGLFVSASPMMQKLRAQVELLAQADVPVLILGEAGSGKYAVATLLHKLSVRSGFRLLKVNCAEMPEALLEAELFGEEGASSAGAKRTGLGKFARGEKGTIFLDEITEMPFGLQARLLQVLQNQSLQKQEQSSQGLPNGGAIPADVRIVAASSVNLNRALAEKRLREELYYSLSVFTVHVPALRQRKDEIAILLRYLMHKLAKHYSLPPRAFSPAMLQACQNYSWPGNLKELETFVKRYLVAGDQELMLGENGLSSGVPLVHAAVGRGVRAATAAPWEQGMRELEHSGLGQPAFGYRGLGRKELGQTELERKGSGQRDLGQRVSGYGEAGYGEAGEKPSEPESLKSLIQGIKSEAEQNAIGAALKRTGWNRKAAARLLRVSYRTLLYKIDQYHMQAPEPFLSPPPVDEFTRQGNGAKGDGKAS
jgi:DNA-binding NtrC family response regulator